MTSTDPTGRLMLLVKVLETYIEDLGYQGLIDAEREAATIMAVLQSAIAHGKTKGLATIADGWAKQNIKGWSR